MTHRYWYLALALFILLLVGILWYSFSRVPATLPLATQSSPSSIATTSPEKTGVDFMTLQPPSGWRALKQSATSVIFTDLPVNAIIYDSSTDMNRSPIVDDDTLGYSEMGIEKLTTDEKPVDGWEWESLLAAKTDPMSGQTVGSIDGKVVESETTAGPGSSATGTMSMVYADTSTIYMFSLDPYQPTKIHRNIGLSSSTIQIYKSFMADFVAQLP